MNPHSYPFDDFAADFDGSHDRLGLQPNDFYGNVGKLLDYMSEKYPDPEVKQYRYMAFMRITMYISDHVHDLDKDDYAVYGSARVGALVSESVFRAVHEVFTANDLSRTEKPCLAEIMRLADKYKAAEAD